ncbi:conserved hypothetical protein [delta proteobacterium NaphS2]|nr:conserved hypothetical protein [delta proteobacterium NaphS2]
MFQFHKPPANAPPRPATAQRDFRIQCASGRLKTPIVYHFRLSLASVKIGWSADPFHDTGSMLTLQVAVSSWHCR